MDPFFLIIQSRKWNSDIKHKHNYTTSSQINMGVYVKCMLVEMLIGFELWPLSSLFIQICRRKSDIKHKQNYTMSNQINMGVHMKCMLVEMLAGLAMIQTFRRIFHHSLPYRDRKSLGWEPKVYKKGFSTYYKAYFYRDQISTNSSDIWNKKKREIWF